MQADRFYDSVGKVTRQIVRCYLFMLAVSELLFRMVAQLMIGDEMAQIV